MKMTSIKVIFLICTILGMSKITLAQTLDYPRYEIDSLGQKVVVMTIEQAMQLDNNSELLSLFEKLNSQIGEYDSVCIKVINDKDKVISTQKAEIAKLNASLSNKAEQITTLQKQVGEYIVKIGILEETVKNRQSVIEEKDNQIRGLKFKMITGGVGGGIMIVGLLLGIILIH